MFNNLASGTTKELALASESLGFAHFLRIPWTKTMESPRTSTFQEWHCILAEIFFCMSDTCTNHTMQLISTQYDWHLRKEMKAEASISTNWKRFISSCGNQPNTARSITMEFLVFIVLLFSMPLATVAQCTGYFCDKRLDTVRPQSLVCDDDKTLLSSIHPSILPFIHSS